jgi:hypothetical protein
MQDLNDEYKRVRYPFWLLWVGVGTLFTTVAFNMGYYIGSAEIFEGLLAFGVPGGILVGIVQWLALRPYLRQASWWILVTIIGWEIGWIIVSYLPEILVRDWFYWPVSGLLLGITIGIAQWVILRQQVSDAYWWIGANILAGFLGSVIGSYIGKTLEFRRGDILGAIIFEIVYSLIFGIIFTVITGTVLVWLLSRTPYLKSVQK